MSIINDRGHKYHGWAVRIGADLPRETEIAEDLFGRGLIRIHCRVARIPSRREFVIRSFTSANAAERDADRKLLASVHRTFERAESAGVVQRVQMRDGRWMFLIWPGTALDDPLVQLELEMMIDQSRTVSA